MPRVKRGTVRRAKRKKLLGLAKGYYANKSKLYRAAKESVDTALKYAFVGRRRKKRDFRRLCIIRINAAARARRRAVPPRRTSGARPLSRPQAQYRRVLDAVHRRRTGRREAAHRPLRERAEAGDRDAVGRVPRTGRARRPSRTRGGRDAAG